MEVKNSEDQRVYTINNQNDDEEHENHDVVFYYETDTINEHQASNHNITMGQEGLRMDSVNKRVIVNILETATYEQNTEIHCLKANKQEHEQTRHKKKGMINIENIINLNIINEHIQTTNKNTNKNVTIFV